MKTRTTSMMGQFPLNLDDKGRVIVPAPLRHRFDPEIDGEGFVIVIGPNNRPWLYPAGRYEELVNALESQLSPDEDRLAFDHMYFSSASEERWDKQGRMPISAELRAETGLGEQFLLIGARDHYELWPSDLWEERKKELAAKRTEIAAKQREAQERVKAARSVKTEGSQM
jgi:MraZ protein